MHLRRLCGLLGCALWAVAPLAGQHIWSGGVFSLQDIPSTIANGSTLAINTGADHDISGQTLTNHGTITWNAGYLRGGNGAVIVNASDGLFSDLNGSSYTMFNHFAGAFSFTNQGNYVRNATGMSGFDIPFDNTGNVDLQQGSIQFRAGGTMGATGTMTTAAGTSILFTAGYTIADGASLMGAGSFQHTGGTMTMNGTLALASYTQSGGSLSGTQVFGSGVFTWQSGNWNTGASETTTIADGAVLNITTGSDHDFSARTITNHGIVNWHAGYLRGGNNSSFVNASDGVFNDLNSSGYTFYNQFAGNFGFVNDGLYARNTGGMTAFDIPFTNNGTIDLDGGAISFRAGGTLASGGIIDAASGTTVLFTNGFTIQDSASLTGAGQFRHEGGVLVMNGAINVGSYLQTGGSLSGSQVLGSGAYTWQAGNWNSGGGETTTIADGAVLNITTGSDHDFSARTITNHGIVNWHAGYLRGGNNSSFVNASDGVFNDLNSSGYTFYNQFAGNFGFVNDGLYARNTGGMTAFDIPFTNNGTIDLDGGSISFRAGGTLTSGGAIDAAAGTTVTFTNGFSIQDGASLMGAGAFHHTGGTLLMNGAVDVGSFLQTGGNFSGTQILNTGIYTWQAGNWNSGGGESTTIADEAILNITTGADHDFSARTITNHGVINWHAGYLRGGNNSSFVNASDGVFHDLNSSGYTIYNQFAGNFGFVNDGLYVRNTGGTTAFDIPFTNNGTIDLDGGSIAFRGGGTLAPGGLIDAASDTTVRFTAGFTIQDSASLTGSGQYQHEGGTLVMNGTVNVGSYLQLGGNLAGTQVFGTGTYTWQAGNWNSGGGETTTIGGGATLNITTGSDHDFSSRIITNSGTVNWHAGYLRGGNDSLFVNAAGGVFNDLNVSGYTFYNQFGGNFGFVNDGTYVRSVAGSTFFDAPFENSGTVILEEGELELRAGATLEPASALRFVLGGPGAQSDYGLLTISSALVLGGNLQVAFANNFQETATSGQTFTLVNASSLGGSFTNVANGNRLASIDGLGTFQVNYGAGSTFGANSVVLSDFQAIPEPSTWALFASGGIFLLFAARRRFRA